jgi:hypothetical protein
VHFEGELNPDELDLVIATGLNYLFKQGALPFKILDEDNAVSLAPGSEEKQ